MKILLADDERLTRLGLKSMIEELYPNQHQFSEVDNGEHLLEYLEEKRPDLIFLDIHMPKLTGLQAFSRFNTQKIPVIMLTGYAEFSYAQEALKLGALDYLLKPASLDEVGGTMEKALSLFQEQQQLQKNDYELEFEKILDLYTTIGFLQPPKFVLPPYTAIFFYFDHYKQESFKQDLDTLKRLLAHICQPYEALFTTTFLSGGELCFITSASIAPDAFKAGLLQFHQTSNCIATGFFITSHQLPSLFAQLETIQKEESLRYCVCLGSLIGEQERLLASRLLPFSSLLEKLLLAHRAGDTVGFQKLLPLLSEVPFEDQVLELCDDSLNRILTIEFDSKMRLHSFQQLTGLFKQMIAQKYPVDLIDKINAYVEQHYMEQIGINTIADMIDISPNYLSRIYKLKTNENFIDHLTSVRIKKAEELMSGGVTTTVRETAERVGYFSTRYFTKVFFKITGILPSEHLKNCQLGNHR